MLQPQAPLVFSGQTGNRLKKKKMPSDPVITFIGIYPEKAIKNEDEI